MSIIKQVIENKEEEERYSSSKNDSANIQKNEKDSLCKIQESCLETDFISKLIEKNNIIPNSKNDSANIQKNEKSSLYKIQESCLETDFTSKLIEKNNIDPNSKNYSAKIKKNEGGSLCKIQESSLEDDFTSKFIEKNNINPNSKVFSPEMFQDNNKDNPNNNLNNINNQNDTQINLQPVEIIKNNILISEPFMPKKNTMIQNFLNKNIIINSFKDQDQTIFLQRAIMGANKETIDFIVNELKGTYRYIIKDKNGNYFCSDLIKVCDKKNRLIILIELSPNLAEDCLDKFATHAIQQLIERSEGEIEYKYILCSFNDYNKFLFAALDPNGAYTIQKIVERIPERFRKEFNFIFTSFIGFTSKTKFGIVTVKKFILETKNENVTAQMMQFIRNNFMNLAEDQYANYLIQYLLEKWKNTSEGNEIKDLVYKNFERLCEKKYSSFICEIFVKKIITEEEKQNLINSLNLDYLINSNNHHIMKILKLLGISNNQNNSQLNLNINNNFIPNNPQNNNMMSRFYNFPNNNSFGNSNNNININNSFGNTNNNININNSFGNNNNINNNRNNNFNFNNFNNNYNNNNNNSNIFEGFPKFHKRKK